MTLLCFLLDPRTISPASLRDLKQALLQLANFYVLSSDRAGRKQQKESIPFLPDQIGLCYLHWSRNSSSPLAELKIAYSPGERFSVRDFHHAVNNISLDNFMPDVCMNMHTESSSSEEIPLEDLLSNNALYKWGSDALPKKLIIICSPTCRSSESLRRSLMDAADRCITVEFVVLEHPDTNLHYDAAEKFMQFTNSICDLENCIIRRYLMDGWLLHGLVKKWFQELKDVLEEPLQAVILFKNSIFSSVNQIHCNLFPSSTHMIDGFSSCQTCRCHGYPIDSAIKNKTKLTCPVTFGELGAPDLIDNVVRIGEQAVLFLPSFEGSSGPQRISAPITLNVIESTSLASLSEGLIMGTSFYVTPSCHETESASDESDKVDLNVQTFHGLCRTLFLKDHGLVCSSTCNTETVQDGTFQCYYILQPSEGGPMLLRRLASSEEILPIPDIAQASDVSIPEEVESSIRASLEKIELRDYNPLQHERGVHAKLNWLVKESLQFGSIPFHSVAKSVELNKLNDLQQAPLTQASEGEEWEKLLIVDDFNSCHSPHPNTKTLNLGAQTKPLDEKTSKILERLEAPKQQNLKTTLPSISKSLIEQIRKPLMPFYSNSSQPLKPNFQKLKRKQR
ncbi:hypothetical protein Cni_G09668 [Canna indica]|uniref:Uncharacterized protein n=1 Tax=Canna indica TaxID=4628 RepID=A0AAQ3K2U5_9LILI|nr:hypothetical protein Cni_G09668 [Canna indica]